MSFDYSSAGKRFASQNELLDCFADVLDLHIYYIYKYHYWVSPENSMQGMLGVVVTVVCHAKRKKLTSKIQKIRQRKNFLADLKHI